MIPDTFLTPAGFGCLAALLGLLFIGWLRFTAALRQRRSSLENRRLNELLLMQSRAHTGQLAEAGARIGKLEEEKLALVRRLDRLLASPRSAHLRELEVRRLAERRMEQAHPEFFRLWLAAMTEAESAALLLPERPPLWRRLGRALPWSAPQAPLERDASLHLPS